MSHSLMPADHKPLTKITDPARLAVVVERAKEHVIAIFLQPSGDSADRSADLSDRSDKSLLPSDYFPIRDAQFLSGAELDAWHERSARDAATRQIGLGMALGVKLMELGTKEFTAWYKANSYSRQQVNDLLAIAQMFGSQHRDVLKQIAQMSVPVQQKLAHLPNGTLQRLATDGVLDSIADMSKREALQKIALIRNLEKKNTELLQRIAERESADREQQSRLRPRHPPTVEAARIHGSAQGMLGNEALSAIERLLFNLTEGVDLSRDTGERRAQIRAGVGPLYVAARGLLARAQQTLTLITEQLGDYLPDLGTDFLTSDEVRDAGSAYDALLHGVSVAPDEIAPRKRGRKAQRKGRA